MTAGADVAVGEELAFAYGGGRLPSDRFLQDYGFLDDEVRTHFLVLDDRLCAKISPPRSIDSWTPRLIHTHTHTPNRRRASGGTGWRWRRRWRRGSARGRTSRPWRRRRRNQMGVVVVAGSGRQWRANMSEGCARRPRWCSRGWTNEVGGWEADGGLCVERGGCTY